MTTSLPKLDFADRLLCTFNSSFQMPKLQEKLEKELKDDGVVIACRFPFPDDWEPADSIDEGIDTVWLYKKQQAGASAGASCIEQEGERER